MFDLPARIAVGAWVRVPGSTGLPPSTGAGLSVVCKFASSDVRYPRPTSPDTRRVRRTTDSLLGLAGEPLDALRIATDFYNWDLEAHGKTLAPGACTTLPPTPAISTSGRVERWRVAPQGAFPIGFPARRWRSTSKMAMPTLVDRLSDRTCGDSIGMATKRSL